MKLGLSVALIILAGLTGCDRTVQTGAIIDRYNQAECIPVTLGNGSSSPTRTWDYTLITLKAGTVQISGRAVPDGDIQLTDRSNGWSEIIAKAGEYIYPADVRFARDSNVLYVRANGMAVPFGGNQTWLFEYDLSQRRQIQRVRVDPNVLTKECLLTPAN